MLWNSSSMTFTMISSFSQEFLLAVALCQLAGSIFLTCIYFASRPWTSSRDGQSQALRWWKLIDDDGSALAILHYWQSAELNPKAPSTYAEGGKSNALYGLGSMSVEGKEGKPLYSRLFMHDPLFLPHYGQSRSNQSSRPTKSSHAVGGLDSDQSATWLHHGWAYILYERVLNFSWKAYILISEYHYRGTANEHLMKRWIYTDLTSNKTTIHMLRGPSLALFEPAQRYFGDDDGEMKGKWYLFVRYCDWECSPTPQGCAI